MAKCEIKNRWTGTVIFSAELDAQYDSESEGFRLGLAVKLAYKSGANLSDANLRGAYLSDANLRGANLSGAKGLAPERAIDLLMLLDQPGKIRAYKLVTASGDSPIHGKKLNYRIGARIEEPEADTDPTRDCAAGINVATLPWCLREWSPGHRVLIVEFAAKDIACIPHATDGKFRLHRCDVVGEKQLDLVALGLVKPAETEAA